MAREDRIIPYSHDAALPMARSAARRSGCRLMEESSFQQGEMQATVLVFERYFFQTRQFVTLTLALFGMEEDTKIAALSAGDGDRAVVDLGAEEFILSDMLKELDRLLTHEEDI